MQSWNWGIFHKRCLDLTGEGSFGVGSSLVAGSGAGSTSVVGCRVRSSLVVGYRVCSGSMVASRSGSSPSDCCTPGSG